MKKLLILILIILVGYFAWTKYGSSEWQTYRHEVVSGHPVYEVMYPKDWKVEVKGPATVIISNNDEAEVIIELYGADGRSIGTPVKESIIKMDNADGNRYDYLTDSNEIFFSTIEFTDREFNGNYPTITLNAAGQKQLKFIPIGDGLMQRVEGDVRDFDVMERVLSTFKFIQEYN